MKPFGNRVFVKKAEVNEVEGIHIPMNTSIGNEPCVGEVVSVPAHRKDVKEGDKIIFAPAQSLRVYVEKDELYLVSYDVIFAIL